MKTLVAFPRGVAPILFGGMLVSILLLAGFSGQTQAAASDMPSVVSSDELQTAIAAAIQTADATEKPSAGESGKEPHKDKSKSAHESKCGPPDSCNSVNDTCGSQCSVEGQICNNLTNPKKHCTTMGAGTSNCFCSCQ